MTHDDLRTPLRDNCPECGADNRARFTESPWGHGIYRCRYRCVCGHYWWTEWRTA